MYSLVTLSILAGFAAPAKSPAQAAQFRWTAGQVLTYRVAQVTKAIETVGEKKQESSTRLDSVKRWNVVSVDQAGVATLTMSLDRLRMENKSPTGETTLYDSADAAKSDPALRSELAKFVGVPIISVRLDARGQLVEVKECKFGPANRLDVDLPFKIVLPAGPLVVGQSWERKFVIKQESAKGEPESFDGLQKVTCKSLADSVAVLSVSTTVTNPPENPADQIPLLPMQSIGEAIFDLATGKLVNVKYQFVRQVRGQQGEESNYSFASSYVEELVP